MPELAEVEIVRLNLERWWKKEAQEVIFFDEKFEKDQRIELENALRSPPIAFIRRGKHLVVKTQNGGIYFHLRMTGKIISSQIPELRFARLAFRVSPGNIVNTITKPWLIFVDSRRLGSIEFLEDNEIAKIFEKLGPEPYDISVQYFNERIGKRRLLKAALLDQKIVAGLGNIAISELFWEYEISPEEKWATLEKVKKEALCKGMGPYFDAIIASQAGEEVNYMNEKGAENPFNIYGRLGEKCPRCETVISRMKVAGRSSYYCPQCQPLSSVE